MSRSIDREVEDILGGDAGVDAYEARQDAYHKTIRELQSMQRVAGLPSDIKKELATAEYAVNAATTPSARAESMRIVKDATYRFDEWRAMNKPQEKKFPWVYVGVGVGGAGLLGGLLWWLWPKKR